MELSVLISSVAIIGGIIGIGALLARQITFTNEARQLLIMIIINIAMPCIILNGIFQTNIDQQLLKEILLIFLAAVFFSCAGIFLGWLGAKLFRYEAGRAREIAILSGLGNTAFIGIPLCATLFGPKGALLAAVFDAGLDFTLWTVGVFLLQRETKFSLGNLKSLLNMPMIAIVAGLIIALLGIHPPELVKGFTFTLSNLASPLAMIYIGITMYNLFRERKKVPVVELSLPLTIKLFIFPIFSALLLTGKFLPAELVQVIIIQTAMPTFAIASILFARYGADEEMGAMTTVCSILLSLLSIPFVVFLCNKIIQLTLA